ncbi:MAG TPA: radical SAM protein [Candidatus Nanoarchaeia archaeon]|nr:radical SAM protein [Candidatus Nanoarchaeia archaeon]
MSYRELPQVKGVDFDIYTQISKRPRSFLDLQVGDRCNFKCVYCFTGAGEEVRGLAEQYRHRTSKIANLLTADEHVGLLDIARKSGIKNLVISSEGENTLYEAQLLEVIRYAGDSGFSIAMFTNGSKIDGKLARKFNDNRITLIAKLNSLNPTKNSIISGCSDNGYTYAELNGMLVPDYIHRLKDAGYSSDHFALNMVINSANQDELLDFWSWAREPSTGIMPFGEFLEPTGFVKGHDELKVSPGRMTELKKSVRKLDHSLGHQYDELPESTRLLDMRFLINPFVVVVDSRGFVKDLAANFDLDSVHGNVRDIDLEQILR